MYVAFISQWACKGQWTIPGNQFSPSTMCIPGQTQVIRFGNKHLNPMSELSATDEAFSSFFLPSGGEECM